MDSRPSKLPSSGEELYQEDDARKYLFDEMLATIAGTDTFSASSSPRFFVVYAHDNEEKIAKAELVRSLIRWHSRIRSKVLSDMSPLLALETGGGDKPVRDIVSNQIRLLRVRTNYSHLSPMWWIDKVVICGSDMLKQYYGNSFTAPYVDRIKALYDEWRSKRTEPLDVLESTIRKFVSSQCNRDGFHHVLTELAFVGLRHTHSAQDNHGITPLSLEDDLMRYLPFLNDTNIVLKLKSVKWAHLPIIFFKLLREVYTDERTFIDIIESCYKDTSMKLRGQAALTTIQWEDMVLTATTNAVLAINQHVIATIRHHKQHNERESPMDAGPKFIVSHACNTNFTCRPAICDKIKHLLLQHESQSANVCIGLLGVAGSGKTEIALHLAYTWQGSCNMFWINGASKTQFATTYSAIAVAAGLVSKDTGEDQACLRSKEWLDSEDSGAWRVVIDGLDDLFESLENFLPTRRGTIIFTSQDKSIRHTTILSTGFVVEVGAMEIAEAGEMVSQLAPGLGSTAHRLLEKLEFWPLAIQHAFSYISSTGYTVECYLKILEKSDDTTLELLAQSWATTSVNETQPSSKLATACTSSFQKVRQKSQPAWEILATMSFLNFYLIPRALLLCKGVEVFGLHGEFDFYIAIGTLLSFGLISCRVESGIERNLPACMELLSLVFARFEEHSTESFLIRSKSFRQRKALLPHAEATLTGRKYLSLIRSETSEATRWKLTYESAKINLLAGHHKHAEYLMKSCGEYYKSQDVSPEKRIQTQIALGLIRKESGDYQEAMSHYDRAMQMYCGLEEEQRQRHASMKSTILVNQGNVLREQDKCEEAEKMYILSLSCQPGPALYEKALYEEARLHIFSCQGSILAVKGETSAALSKLEQALQGWDLIGEDDQRKCYVLSEIASIHSQKYEHELAIQKYGTAIKGTTFNLGASHPKTLLLRANYALALIRKVDYAGALRVSKSVLKQQIEVLGEEHPKTMATRHDIGVSLSRLDCFEEALKEYDKFIRWSKNKGESQPLPLEYYQVVKGRADALRLSRDYEAALKGYDEAWKGAHVHETRTDTLFQSSIQLGRAQVFIAQKSFKSADMHLAMVEKVRSTFPPNSEIISELADIREDFKLARPPLLKRILRPGSFR